MDGRGVAHGEEVDDGAGELLELALHDEAVGAHRGGGGEEEAHVRDHAQPAREVQLAARHAAVGEHLEGG